MRTLIMAAALWVIGLAGCGGDDKPTTPPPTGACCALNNTCLVTTQENCTGAWIVGGACDPNPCVLQPPTGMVLVAAGTFTMGSPENESGRGSDEPQHVVTLTKAIYVSLHEVTQSEWRAVTGWNDSEFPGLNRPVDRVNWYDAVNYCNQRSALDGLTPAYSIADVTYSGNHVASANVSWNQAADGYRLLSEAEWEYACRATSMTAFCDGDITYASGCSPLDPNLNRVAWYCGNASAATHDVQGKQPNAWGLYDMHGNVREWCWDYYGSYGPTMQDPIGPASGDFRVVRDGSWDGDVPACRSAKRDGSGPGAVASDLGFRVCRNGE